MDARQHFVGVSDPARECAWEGAEAEAGAGEHLTCTSPCACAYAVGVRLCRLHGGAETHSHTGLAACKQGTAKKETPPRSSLTSSQI